MEPRHVRRNVKDYNKKLCNLREDYDSGRRDLRNFYVPWDTAYDSLQLVDNVILNWFVGGV